MNVITPTATKTNSATTQIMIAVISKVTPVFVLPLLAPTTVLAPISSAKQVIPSNIDIAAAVTAEVNFFIISIIPFFFLQRLLYYISSEKASGKLYKFFQSSAKFIL